MDIIEIAVLFVFLVIVWEMIAYGMGQLLTGILSIIPAPYFYGGLIAVIIISIIVMYHVVEKDLKRIHGMLLY